MYYLDVFNFALQNFRPRVHVGISSYIISSPDASYYYVRFPDSSQGRPPAQIGLRSALEMAHAERTTKSFCRNMSALRNRISHQVDADGEHRRSGWMVDGGQLLPDCNVGATFACAQTTPGPRRARQLIRTTVLPSHTHHHYSTCARRGACSCCSATRYRVQYPVLYVVQAPPSRPVYSVGVQRWPSVQQY